MTIITHARTTRVMSVYHQQHPATPRYGLTLSGNHAVGATGGSSRVLPSFSHRAQVFVDGERVFAAAVPFPRHISEPLSRCSIGWDLDGQTSGILVFSRAVDVDVLEAMLDSLADGMQAKDVERGHGLSRQGSQLLPDLWGASHVVSGGLWSGVKPPPWKSSLLAAFMPSRTVKGQCLEPHSGYHAKLRRPGTHAWTRNRAQDVIGTIGGSPSLLLLANQLLRDRRQSHAPATPHGGEQYESRNIDTVVSLVLAFVDGNRANQVRCLRLLSCFVRSGAW